MINYEATERPFSILKIDIQSEDGTKYLPQYIQIIKDEIPSINGRFYLKHYKYGVILEFETDEFVSKIPNFTYEKDGYRKSLNMHRTNKNLFETPLIKSSKFNEYKNIEIQFPTEPIHVMKYDLDNILVTPNENFKLLYNSGKIILKGDKYTFNDTSIIWIEEALKLVEDNTVTIIKPILIGPTRLKFNKFIELIIKVDNRIDLDYSSIYKYNKANKKWIYIPSTIDKKSLALISNIDSGGIYAVIKEKKTPIIKNIYPGNNGVYYQDDFKEIKFDIFDDESGIKDETNIKIQIDDQKPLIFEYNTYRKQVVYKLEQKIEEGKHELKIEAHDNVGNKLFRKHQFYIKK